MKIQDPSVKPGFVNHGIERRIMVSPHKDLNAHSNLVDWKVWIWNSVAMLKTGSFSWSHIWAAQGPGQLHTVTLR